MKIEENKKHFKDLKCKGSTNVYYQILALSKQSQNKVKQKFNKILPQNSRFRDL